jgi:hypothetical protein
MTENLGKKFILHTVQGRTADEVIISAHGTYSWGDGHFEVPEGITVNFYNPHGTGLKATNTSLRNFMVGAGFPVFSTHTGVSKEGPIGHPAGTDEHIHPTTSVLLHDYTLTHFEIDTTESIDAAMNEGQAKAKEALGRPDGPIESVIAIDVLTVKEGRPATLSEAIELLPKRYKVIHCSFCRVNQAVKDWFPTYQPASATQQRQVSSGWWDSNRKWIPHNLPQPKPPKRKGAV